MASLSPTRRRLLWIGCLVPFLGSIALMAWYWPGALPQDSSSGVWTALAQDFAKGVFYRATVSAFGFGGTRYMPLFFVLHGALIRLAFDPVTAGIERQADQGAVQHEEQRHIARAAEPKRADGGPVEHALGEVLRQSGPDTARAVLRQGPGPVPRQERDGAEEWNEAADPQQPPPGR